MSTALVVLTILFFRILLPIGLVLSLGELLTRHMSKQDSH